MKTWASGPIPAAYFQNPTGALADGRARRAAMRSLRAADALVVVDETFAELALDDVEPPPPLASFGRARTVTIGSLAKAAWGGLRVGWARAEPAVVQRLAAARATSDMASPVLEQLVAVQVLARREEVVGERRRRLRTGREALERALAPTGWRFSRPAGGAFLWVELPAAIASSLAVSAHERGVHVTPGPRFGAAGLLERFLRLPFTLPSERLAEAVGVLAGLAVCPAPSGARTREATYVA